MWEGVASLDGIRVGEEPGAGEGGGEKQGVNMHGNWPLKCLVVLDFPSADGVGALWQ
jgi:hypothetical protein